MDLFVNLVIQQIVMEKRGTNLKTLNGWNLFVNVEVQDAPHPFRWSDVAPVNEMLYFVAFILKCCSVRAFVNVFKAIFHGTEGRDGFNISVTVIFCREVRIIRHNPRIIYPDRSNTRNRYGKRSSIVGSCIQWVPILICRSGVMERFRIPFRALTVFHTRRRWIDVSTRTVDHSAFYCLE